MAARTHRVGPSRWRRCDSKWACNGGAHQTFNSSRGKPVAKHLGKCIAVSRALTNPGAGLVQWNCAQATAHGTCTLR